MSALYSLVASDKYKRQKQELGITLSDCDIQGVKNFVAKKVKTNHLKYLTSLKQKHSKAKFLNCTVLKQADYLADSRFSTKEKQLLFKLRSKTLDVKQNFGGLRSKHRTYQTAWAPGSEWLRQTNKS